MRIPGLLMFFILCSTRFVAGQIIELVDKKSDKGIENVSIYNLAMNRSTQTDKAGKADLSIFSESDILLFQHPSYHAITLAISDISTNGYRVELEERIIKIDELIISASKWEQDPSRIPYTVSSISSKEIEFKNPPTSADMLDMTGQIFLQKSQQGGGSPMIRGFSANKLLIVLDGVRLNNAIYRSGNLHNVIGIDVNSIEEAEVLFGPGSVMYGSDALGGVMDFHTGSPELNGDEKTKFDTNVLIRYATAAREKTSHVDFTISSRKLGTHTSISFSDFDDLITGDNRTKAYPDFGKRTEFVSRIYNKDSILKNGNVNLQKFSGYRQINLIQKFIYRPKDYLDIDYGFYLTNTSDIPRYDRLIQYDEDSLPVNSVWNYGPQKWLMNRFGVHTYRANVLFSEARFTLSHQLIQESRIDRKYMDVKQRNRKETVHALNFNADFDKSFKEGHQLFYGLEFSYNRIKSEAESINIETGEFSWAATRYPDGGSNYGFLAAYVNYLWTLNEKHSFNSGVRYTSTGLNASLKDSSEIEFDFDGLHNRNRALNGSVGWVYRVCPKTAIDIIVASGFRAPNLDDMGKLFDSEPGYVIVPNENLSPEYAYNLELGLSQKIGRNLEFHIVGYHTWLVDAMVRRDFTFNGFDSLLYDGEFRKTQALVNTGRANIYGISLTLRGDLSDRFGVNSSLNFTGGEDLIENEPLRHVPPLFGRASLLYREKSFLFEFNVQYSGSKEYDELAPSEKNKIYLYTPEGALAWYTLNFRVSYEFRDSLIINIGLENLLDKHYRTYSSGISAPGRNFILGLRLKI